MYVCVAYYIIQAGYAEGWNDGKEWNNGRVEKSQKQPSNLPSFHPSNLPLRVDRMVKDDPERGAGGLLIHPGGLGDVCLSESTLLSLERHFGATLEAVGTRRVLDMFRPYFTGVDSIDRRTWIYLFSDSPVHRTWQRIIFIGKDRTGALRKRISRLCDDFIFIDMYPDDQPVHVEDYQLRSSPGTG